MHAARFFVVETVEHVEPKVWSPELDVAVPLLVGVADPHVEELREEATRACVRCATLSGSFGAEDFDDLAVEHSDGFFVIGKLNRAYSDTTLTKPLPCVHCRDAQATRTIARADPRKRATVAHRDPHPEAPAGPDARLGALLRI